MDRATQARLTARIRDLRRRRSTDLAPSTYRVPASDYTSAPGSPRRLDSLFLRGPLLAGLSGDAREPGDWFSFEACGRSAVVWRQPDGALRAFVNACRHRGMRVASACGRGARSLVCPYHCVELRPRRPARPPSPARRASPTSTRRDRADAAAACTRRPASSSSASTPERAGHGAILARRRRRSSRPSRLGLVPPGRAARASLRHQLEAHRRLLHGGLPPPLPPRGHAPARSSTATSRRSTPSAGTAASSASGARFDELREAAASLLPHVTLLYQLFPNAVLIYQQDHVELYQSFPDLARPGRVRRARDALRAAGARRATPSASYWKKNLDLIDGVTTTEDFAACEKIQANLRAGAVPFLILGRNEPGVAHFHRTLHAGPRTAPKGVPPCTSAAASSSRTSATRVRTRTSTPTSSSMADLVEPLGFDSVWAAEHHFTDYTMCPDPVSAPHLASRAGRSACSSAAW